MMFVMPATGQSGRQRHFVLRFSAHSFISLLPREHDNLKTSEPVSLLVQVGTRDCRGRKRSTLESASQRSGSDKAEIGRKNPFW